MESINMINEIINIVKKRPIELGKLDNVKPVSSVFGLDRGNSVDRYYIESFLAQNSKDICGDVLEIENNNYTVKYGGSRVSKSHILHVNDDNKQATIISDLTKADNIPDNSFDCIILTQTLQFIYDLHAAMRNVHRILKPNGVLLISVPGISQISRYDMDRWGDYWRFTTLSAEMLAQEYFENEKIEVKSHGNVLIATALLQGLSINDVSAEKFEYNDPDYQVIITIKLIK